MITKEIAALMSLRVYEEGVRQDLNQPNFPYQDWDLVRDPRLPAVTNGFAYGVFRNQGTGEVVISYRGTDGAGGMFGYDGLNNAALSSAAPSSQGTQAAQLYAEVLRLYGADAQGSNISFTGHSLGGGLASVMAVWFNRPAIVFDPAPFRPTAQSQERVDEAIALLGANAPQAIKTYNTTSNYAARAQQVSGYFAQGEFLGLLRTDASTVNLNAIAAQQFGNQNVNGFAMHSQALLTMGLMSSSFKAATVQVQNALPLILSDKLYSQETNGLRTRNFLLDLIRSEQTTPANGKLTHFSADLNKLGTNLAGLNKAAQEAMIAQGIEWYYWQDKNYSGVKEFFTKTGDLLQYTLAKADKNADGTPLTNLNKADLYTKPWLQAIAAEHGTGTSTFPAFGTAYDQWNVAAGTTGVTATARATDKAQIFIGQGGGDTFTGGSKNDVIYAGAGADTINGGGGNDLLYGGKGNDTYQFTASYGKDQIIDSDSLGQIKIDSDTLTGGKSVSQNIWVSQDNKYGFAKVDLGGGKTDLLIVRAGSADNIVTIKDFKAGDLGLDLEGFAAGGVAVVASTSKLQIDTTSAGFSPIGNTYYAYDGSAQGYLQASGAVMRASALPGSGATGGPTTTPTTTLYGGALYGLHLDDELYGSTERDIIFGGGGADRVEAGAGDDVVLVGAGNNLPLPGASPALGYVQGDYEGYYKAGITSGLGANGQTLMLPLNAQGALLSQHNDTTPGLKARFAQGSVIDGGQGSDRLYGGIGGDTLYGGDGVDIDKLYGGYGSDTLSGGDGDDTLSGDARLFDDTDGSQHGQDILLGGAGSDRLTGGGNSDVLEGGAGDDVLMGDVDINDPHVQNKRYGQDIATEQRGDDYLDGGAGDDFLLGDAGGDEVHYQYRSCLRAYQLAYSRNRYLKTAKKASHHTSNPRRRTYAAGRYTMAQLVKRFGLHNTNVGWTVK